MSTGVRDGRDARSSDSRADPSTVGATLGVVAEPDPEAVRAMERFRRSVLGRAPAPIRVGRYALGELLGVGGMAVVFAARDPELNRDVAVKLLRTSSAERRSGLRAECRALAALVHPNVVRIYDVGEYEAPALGQIQTAKGASIPSRGLYMVMERLHGKTLAQWSDDRSSAEILEAIVAAGRGVAVAHRAGVIHRDLKPSNVLVTRDGTAKVLDFGVAFASQETPDGDAEATEAAFEIAGTPGYMAPEQRAGAVPDPRCDQFALCATALVVLGASEAQALLRSTPQVPGAWEQGLATLRRPRGVPRRAFQAILRGLSLDPDRRFADMDALLGRLRPSPRRWPTMAAVGVGGLVAAWASVPEHHTDDDCRRLDRAAREVWTDARLERIAVAMRRTQLPYASATARTVESAVDAFERRWWAAHEAVCATSVAVGSVAAEHQLACLDGHLATMDTLLSSLEETTAGRLPSVVVTIDGLSSIEDCSEYDAGWLTDGTAASRELVHSLHEAKGLALAGRDQAAVERFGEVATQARARGWTGLEAEAKLGQARAWIALGELEPAESLVYELVFATRDGSPTTRAGALVEMAAIDRTLGRWKDASAHVQQARAAITGLPGHTVLEGRLLQVEADLAFVEGRWVEAEQSYRVLLERGDIDASVVLSNLATAVFAQGRNEEALQLYERARAHARANFGDAHPVVGQLVGNLGNAYVKVGRVPEGLAAARRAVEVARLGREPFVETRARNNLAGLLLEVGEAEEALDVLERALRRKGEGDGSELGPMMSAALLLNLQLARIALGRWDAFEDDMQATRTAVDALGPDHPLRANLYTVRAEAALHARDPAASTLAHTALATVEQITGDPVALGDACDLVARVEAAAGSPPATVAAWRVAARAHYANAGAMGALRLEQVTKGRGPERRAHRRATSSSR